MAMSPGLAAYRLSYQISPIILTGGLAQNIPGGMLPIISLTEAVNFVDGLLGGGDIGLDDFFANFRPMPGGELANNAIGNYPFANQSVAANAIIAQPLKLSMLMIIPVRDEGGYAAKLATMLALKAALDQHDQSGGTYTIATSAHFYDNMIRTGMRDASNPGSKQDQNAWQIDFVRPLVTLAQAAQAQNSMMNKISSGLPSDGALSGLTSTVGYVPTVATSSVAPAATGPAGTSIAGLGSYGPQGSIDTLQ